MNRGRQSYKSQWDQRFRDRAIIDGLKGATQNTLRLMATYSNADGTSISVGQATLAGKQGIADVRTIRRHQKQGEAAEWIVCQHRGRGPGDPNIYRLNIPGEPDIVARDSQKGNRASMPASPDDSNEGRALTLIDAGTDAQNYGHQCPPTMGHHGYLGAAPTGAATKNRLIRPSDIQVGDETDLTAGSDSPAQIDFGTRRPPERMWPRRPQALRH